MSKRKKPKRSRKPKKSRRRSAERGPQFDGPIMFEAPPGMSGLPDRRAMEGIMRQMLGTLGDETAGAVDSRAQDLIYQAFDTVDVERRIQLAQQALAIDPDCADAYVLLGENANSAEEACRLFEQGVAAGERALGQEAFDELEGHFWGVLDTRSYMRARRELADVLWHLGRRAEAVGHYEELLRLNPNDNQGTRYVLLGCLLQSDRDKDAEALLEQFGDDIAAEWTYGRALHAFRREGNTARSRQLLLDAQESNPHVPLLLAGQQPLPSELPDYIQLGEESEAISYVVASLPVWRGTSGAIPWLRDTLNVALPSGTKPRGPAWSRIAADVAELPQDKDEVWHVDVRRLFPKSREDDVDNPWVLFVTSPTREQVVATDVMPEQPNNATALRQLAKVMLDPEDEDPRRPGVVLVRLKSTANGWKGKLSDVGIQCRQASALDDIDAIHESLATAINQRANLKDSPPLSDAELLELPQAGEELWQADIRRLATWFGGEGTPQRPWSAMVTSRSEETILAQDLTTDDVAADWLAKTIRTAMSNPVVGAAHRPGIVAVCNEQFHAALAPWLSALNINCELHDELDHLESIVDDLTKHMAGEDAAQALLEAPGVEPQHVAGFFAAAADFYRYKPWRTAPSDVPIKVECDRFTSGPWYAVVMGQSGMCEGVALYEDFDQLVELLTSGGSDEAHARSMSALSVQFGEAFDIPNLDLYHAEKYGWPVAGPEAYPMIMRVNPGIAVRRPLAWELELAEACLRAVPEFLSNKDRSPHVVKTAISTGPVELTLSWAPVD